MTNQRGFTLVELSIVLVILGLLVGGVLTGQTLIHAAELRSVTTQEQRYVTAVQTFRDKYFALPGDMPNAQTYWGIAATCPGDSSTVGTGTQTCNGDGDGKIMYSATTANEDFRFWQHLANAGLIEGSYTGTSADTTATHLTATTANAPSGRISASLWWVHNYNPATGLSYIFDGTYDNFIGIGMATAGSFPSTALLKPEDGYNIDTKMDDGKPATGKVVIRQINFSSNCTDAAASSTLTANYNLTNTTVSCNLLWRQAF